VSVFRVSDGEQALEYLRGEEPYAGSDRPDFVFLDLHMPRMDGWQVLKEMRGDRTFRSIPVIVFSSSCIQADRDRAYALGARRFVMKPASFSLLVAEIQCAYRALVAENG